MYFAACGLIFVSAYVLNVLVITVGYHRGLAHKAVRLRPWLRRAVIGGGIWITGLDPRAWVVMHRLHHQHSDTPEDPHSPTNVGILGIGLEQLRNYKRTLIGLIKHGRAYERYAADLDFPVNRLNRSGLWYLPYALHLGLGLILGLTFGWVSGAAYFAGMMSHPVQGALVNALGHAWGGRNFDTPDNSRNNHLVAWLILGEGFQNNHHRYPSSASFSFRRREIDLGYAICWLFARLKALEIDQAALIPRPSLASIVSPARFPARPAS